MKKFHFTLETLAEIRRRKEDAVKLRLAAKNREVLAAQQRLEGIDQSLAELNTVERIKRQDATTDVSDLKHALTYRHKLQRDIIKTVDTIETLSTQAVGIRNELVNASKDKKALELLRDNRFAGWKYDVRIAERNFNDDVSAQKYIRTMQHASRATRHATV